MQLSGGGVGGVVSVGPEGNWAGSWVTANGAGGGLGLSIKITIMTGDAVILK